MSEPLFNSAWYSVADLKVKLKQHTDIHRHIYRGGLVYILQDNVTGQFHRFTPEVYRIISLMNGKRTLQKIWEMACEALGDDMPTQNDIINLVSKLYRTNVIVSDKLPAIDDIDERRKQYDRKQLAMKFKSPLSIRIPLLDPERFLVRTYHIVRPLIGPAGALIWLIVVAYGVLQALVHWEPLSHNAADKILALENIILMAFVYPVVKLVHELGHAYCVKKWGGQVHEVGIMLLVFFPVPYVDATSATAFRNKYQRMLVGAAGILVEVFLAASAMIVWTYLEEGVMRALVFNIMLIAGVSTVLFNGNPLLKFDAYYVLADYLEIPNLATRSNNYIGYLVKRYLFSVNEISSPSRSTSESIWLAAYSLLAFFYRIFITIAITVFMASEYLIVGVLIGAWFAYMSFVGPMLKIIAKPVTDPMLKKIQSRVYARSTVILSVFVILIFIIPFPLSTQSQGVLLLDEQSYIRAEVDGFVSSVMKNTGDHVQADTVLLETGNAELNAKVEILGHQLIEAQERYRASLADKSTAEIIREELKFVENEYQRAKELQEKQKIISHRQGRLVIFDQNNLSGRYVVRGQNLGYIAEKSELPVAVMISEDDIDLVENYTQQVELKYVSNPGKTYPGTIQRISPSSSDDLVSPVLSIKGGGDIALNPDARDKERAYERYYVVEVKVSEIDHGRIDERIYVVFRHHPEALFNRLYRAVRRSFLRQFDA